MTSVPATHLEYVVSELAVLDPVASAKNGQKTALITRGGKQAIWFIPGLVQPLWQPSAFSNSLNGESSGRLSLCLKGTEDFLKEAQLIDNWAIDYAANDSERFFGKKLSADQIKDRYNGIYKASDKYDPFVKVKLASDKGAPTYWTPEKTQRGAPEDFTNSQLMCQIRLVGFWFMQTSWGLTAQLSSALVAEENQVSCPF